MTSTTNEAAAVLATYNELVAADSQDAAAWRTVAAALDSAAGRLEGERREAVRWRGIDARQRSERLVRLAGLTR